MSRGFLVPADRKLHGLRKKVPADGNDDLRFCVRSFTRRVIFCPLPEDSRRARDGQRRVFDDQLSVLMRELPVNLPLAVAGDVISDLEHFRKIIARALVGVILGVVDVRGRGREHQRLQKRIRLHDARAVRVKVSEESD